MQRERRFQQLHCCLAKRAKITVESSSPARQTEGHDGYSACIGYVEKSRITSHLYARLQSYPFNIPPFIPQLPPPPAIIVESDTKYAHIPSESDFFFQVS